MDLGMDHLDPGVSMGLGTAWAAIEVRQHECSRIDRGR